MINNYLIWKTTYSCTSLAGESNKISINDYRLLVITELTSGGGGGGGGGGGESPTESQGSIMSWRKKTKATIQIHCGNDQQNQFINRYSLSSGTQASVGGGGVEDRCLRGKTGASDGNWTQDLLLRTCAVRVHNRACPVATWIILGKQ